MNRGAAGKAVKRCGYLSAADKQVFMTLLDGANNEDCKVPPFQTPTIPELVTWTGLHRATVFRAMAHLEKHQWLKREPGKGRGHKSRYHLVFEEPDALCHCEKVAQNDPLEPKRSHTATERVALPPESSQVEPRFDTREHRGEEKGEGCKVNPDDDCQGAATLLSCQLCPKSPTYWRKSA